jgi:DNA-binding winged helix-turn-helix (wHTH) protein
MADNATYEFAGFSLDSIKRTLRYHGDLRPLRPTAFDLLLALVESQGRSISKSQIIERVWGSNSGDDRNFHVTLHAVRQALNESAQEPTLIVRDTNGYRVAVPIRTFPSESGEPLKASSEPDIDRPIASQIETLSNKVSLPGPRRHPFFLLSACTLYAALYGVAVILEIAYDFDRFGSSSYQPALLAFCWMLVAAVASLSMDRRLTLRGRPGGLVTSCGILMIAALVLFGFLTQFLPDSPITKAGFQTYPARAAYLKDAASFLLLALLFLILPYHFIAAMEGEIERGHQSMVLRVLRGHKAGIFPGGTVYPRLWVLVLVLAGLATAELIAAAHLLDNLTPGAHSNLFVELFYLRAILYFGLGLFCLVWYYGALSGLKRHR